MFVKYTGGIGIINIADADPCRSEIHPYSKCTRNSVYFTPVSQQRRGADPDLDSKSTRVIVRYAALPVRIALNRGRNGAIPAVLAVLRLLLYGTQYICVHASLIYWRLRCLPESQLLKACRRRSKVLCRRLQRDVVYLSLLTNGALVY